MKKLVLAIVLLTLMIFGNTIYAYDDISSFEVDPKDISMVVNDSKDIKFTFRPSESIGEVHFCPEYSENYEGVVEVSTFEGGATIKGLQAGKATICFEAICRLMGENNKSYRYVEVEVVGEDIVKDVEIESNIKSIDTVYAGKSQENYVEITVKPESFFQYLIYSSDDEKVAQVSYRYGNNFMISVVGEGQTTVHFSIGNKRIDIPIISRVNSPENYVDPVLPQNISKSIVKSAYETYIKQYNTPFQSNNIMDCTIDGTYNRINGNSVLNNNGVTVSENFHNFYRVITGLGTVKYTAASNAKAQIGADFMNKKSTMGHDIADGEDPAASSVLHSSNLTLAGAFGPNYMINGWFSDINSRKGLMGIGHRIWMLDPIISDYGIATTNSYGDQYYNLGSKGGLLNKANIIAVPARGEFPIEAFQDGGEVWSLSLGYDYIYQLDNIRIFVSYNNETIELRKDDESNPNGYFTISSGYGDSTSINFYPKKFITDSNGKSSPQYLNNKTFTVRIEGLWRNVCEDGVNYNDVPCKPLEYTTHFFSILDEGWNPTLTSFDFIDQSTGQPLTSPINMKVGDTKTVVLSNITPSQYASQAEMFISNPLYPSLTPNKINSKTFTITAVKPVSGQISFQVYNTGKSKNYTVNITGNSNTGGTESETPGGGLPGGGAPLPGGGAGLPGGTGTEGSTDSGESQTPTPSPGPEQAKKYSVNISIDNSAMGEINGAGTYESGTTVSVKAVPADGYEFKEWTENGKTVSTSATYTFKINSDRNLKAVFTKKAASTEVIEIYRLYNNVSGEHLYTSDSNEKNVLSAQRDWDYEGISWSSPKTGEGVYRLYSPVTGFHLYTTDANEVNTLASRGWQVDFDHKPLYYSGGSVPIYRLYNEGLRQHLLTRDLNEYNTLPGHGWTQEGQKINAAS